MSVNPERLSDLLAPLFNQNSQVDSANQNEQTSSNMEQQMTPAQLIAQAQAQSEAVESAPLSFEGEPQRRFKIIYENGLWMIEEKSSGRRSTLTFNDWIEFYHPQEAHFPDGKFKGSTSGRIIDWDSNQLHIKYQNYRYLMGSGVEVYNYQPVQFNIIEKPNNNYILNAFLIVLLLCGTITTLALTGWF